MLQLQEGDIELSEGEVLLRVASPGQIDSRDPTATYRNLTRPVRYNIDPDPWPILSYWLDLLSRLFIRYLSY